MADTKADNPHKGSPETPSAGEPVRVFKPVAFTGLVFVLAITWLLWSGIYKPLILILGAISCGLVAWLAVRMGFFNTKSILPLLPKLPFYWLWLLKEIAKSSFDVARIVLSPRLECSPTIVDFEGDPKTEMGQVILGNSITLTPGTVTLDIYKDRLVVHCLTQKGAASLQKGEMSRRVAALEAD